VVDFFVLLEKPLTTKNVYTESSLITKDYYKLLGLLPHADEVVVKAAYKALAQKNHPDKHPEQKVQQNKVMSELNEAFAVLGSKANRKAYDQRLEKFTQTKQTAQADHKKQSSDSNNSTSKQGADSDVGASQSHQHAHAHAHAHAQARARENSNERANPTTRVEQEIIEKLKQNQIDEYELINLFEKTFSLKIEVKNGYINNYSYKKEGKVHVLNFENIKIQLIEHLNVA
jgi:curved DNA-binding protein CbpA